MKLQARLFKALSKTNIDMEYWSNNATGYGKRGIPDITLIIKNQVYFIEIKDKGSKDKISKIQEFRFKRFEKLGFKVIIIKDDNDINSFIGGLSG